MNLFNLYEEIKVIDKKTGAGAIIYCPKTKRILLQLRSNVVSEPLTWGTIGGILNKGEAPKIGCKREIREEIGFDGNIKLIELYVFENETLKYHNYIGIVDEEFEPKLNWESTDCQWIDFGTWPLKLHFGIQEILKCEEALNILNKECE